MDVPRIIDVQQISALPFGTDGRNGGNGMSQDSGQDFLNNSPEELLKGEFSLDFLDEEVSSPDGTSLKSKVIEIGAMDDAGNPIALVFRRRVSQNSGEVLTAQEAVAYCSQCGSFSSQNLVPCKGCGKGACIYCCIRRNKDESYWHRSCSRKDKLLKLLRALIALPIRPFCTVVDVDKDREK
jgi:hypothetical protein